MNPIKYANFSQIYSEINSLLQDENKWNEVKAPELRYFICFNLQKIMAHTQNALDAQDTQEKLLMLSDKINEKFSSSYAHNLAFEIMGIAQGIFSKEEDKNDYTSLLPPEIRQKIYEEFIFTSWKSFQNHVNSGLESVRLVSKKEYKVAEETKIAWLNNNNVSLESFGCKTLPAAIQYLKIIKIYSMLIC